VVAARRRVRGSFSWIGGRRVFRRALRLPPFVLVAPRPDRHKRRDRPEDVTWGRKTGAGAEGGRGRPPAHMGNDVPACGRSVDASSAAEKEKRGVRKGPSSSAVQNTVQMVFFPRSLAPVRPAKQAASARIDRTTTHASPNPAGGKEGGGGCLVGQRPTSLFCVRTHCALPPHHKRRRYSQDTRMHPTYRHAHLKKKKSINPTQHKTKTTDRCLPASP
jgi:hypothetical protein